MSWRQKMASWLARGSALGEPPALPDALWQATLAARGFLRRLTPAERQRLRELAAHFLRRKEFSGGAGLVVTDAMAVDIAVQACLPLLHWGPPREALAWYDDFVGIIIYPGEVLVRRQFMDEAGVVHSYKEPIMGEAMEHGPIVLSWSAARPDAHARDNELGEASNVVIHEFAHKIDMRNGAADGCPPLPAGFMGATSAQQGYGLWREAWSRAFERFGEQVVMAERFGAPMPWLDSYGAEAPAEFFAVACEAFFVDRPRFALEFPGLAELLLALFEPADS
jgi:Mlc titration factor MtfA (ptsG expression regulator)